MNCRFPADEEGKDRHGVIERSAVIIGQCTAQGKRRCISCVSDASDMHRPPLIQRFFSFQRCATYTTRPIVTGYRDVFSLPSVLAEMNQGRCLGTPSPKLRRTETLPGPRAHVVVCGVRAAMSCPRARRVLTSHDLLSTISHTSLVCG